MKIIKIALALCALAISLYGLITKDFSASPIANLLLGIFFAIIGIEELKTKGENSWGVLFMLVSLLVITAALFSF